MLLRGVIEGLDVHCWWLTDGFSRGRGREGGGICGVCYTICGL